MINIILIITISLVLLSVIIIPFIYKLVSIHKDEKAKKLFFDKIKPGTILISNCCEANKDNPFISDDEKYVFIKIIEVKDGWVKYAHKRNKSEYPEFLLKGLDDPDWITNLPNTMKMDALYVGFKIKENEN